MGYALSTAALLLALLLFGVLHSASQDFNDEHQ